MICAFDIGGTKIAAALVGAAVQRGVVGGVVVDAAVLRAVVVAGGQAGDERPLL